MSSSHVRAETVDLDGQPVGVLTIDRPDKRNALTPEMLAELDQGARELGSASHALLLRGEGTVFCAGFDLSLCVEAPDGAVMRELLTGLDRFIRTLRGLPIGVVASVQGAALAGGCAVLGGCELVIAHPESKLGYPVVRIGVSPAVSAPTLMSRLSAGATRSRQLDPGLIDARRAHELGLVDVLSDDPEREARAHVQAFASKPPEAFARTKAWLNELTDAESEMGLDAGASLARSLDLTGGDEERAMLPRALRR
ncbi:MAG: enoyl-CoA hydratase/isomerase family protein [Planctomycetota bacterium]